MLHLLSPARSLNSKLILFLLLSLCIPLLGITLYNNETARANLREIAHKRSDALTYGSAERIHDYLSERQSDTTVLASLLTVRTLLENGATPQILDEVSARLTTARDAYGYETISVLDATGKVVYTTNRHLMGQDLGQRPEVQQAQQGNVALSEVGADPGENDLFLHCVAPVRDEAGNRIIGSIDARATLDKLNEIVASDNGRTGEGSYSVILDKDLIRIAIPFHKEHVFGPEVALPADVTRRLIAEQRFGPETADKLEQSTSFPEVKEAVEKRLITEDHATFSGPSITGEQTEGIIRKIPGTTWYYLHRIPSATFDKPVNEQTTFALLVTLVAALLASVAVIFFTHQVINQPLDKLVHAAQALESGDLSRRLTFKREDEIGRLSTSFNAMADALETRIMAEQSAREEARRLQEAERANRELLEQTVAEYLTFMQLVAQGDLTRRLHVERNGALGSLGQGLNTMVENLHVITSQVQQASTNIAAAAAEILAATTQQASSAAEQSSAIAQTSTTVEEIKMIAVQTAQQAGQVAQDSQAALTVARQGTHSVEETITTMQQIRQRVESIAQTILSLSEQTQAIGTIITTVSELADQSNLLALNAAIEAARAGEQGRSFAIVAQHVRDLAERSKAATRQVREILEEIRRATNASVLVTEEGNRVVESGTQLAAGAGQVIHRIATEVETGAQANVQMAAAAHQQTAGMEQIGQAMLAIQQATTQALASTRQAERAAQDLHLLAQTLQQTVGAYRL